MGFSARSGTSCLVNFSKPQQSPAYIGAHLSHRDHAGSAAP